MRRPSFTSFVLVCAVATASAIGCIDRPVVPIDPQENRAAFVFFHSGASNKVDLLVVVDNSSSMADKQSELGKRIPELVSSLIAPEPGQPRVTDLHVAVITSSLGSHGTSLCDSPHGNDGAHLLPRADATMTNGFALGSDGEPVAAACPKIATSSVLSWTADASIGPSVFVGDAQVASMQAATSCVVASAGQDGCGFESTLEAAYRFLVEPSPYLSAAASCAAGGSCTPVSLSGLDHAVLDQRKAFLRDDSLLAVLFITDENDASFDPVADVWKPEGVKDGAMPRAWGGCASIADDVEPVDGSALAEAHCKSCEDDPSDAACSTPWPKPAAGIDGDTQNLRAFHEVQRFGRNWLFSRDRYVDAFSSPTISIGGKKVANPLFARRSSDQVIVAAITGVPKTLVADASGSPKTLADADWSKIADANPAQRSPYMIESIAPRDGVPKFAGDRSVDAVNGGDRVIASGADLEYACIAPRSASTCSDPSSCDCPDAASPLCAPDKTQPYFKAYPGLRQLRVLRDVDARTHNAFVASICDTSYAPAVRGIVDKLRAALSGSCTQENLPPNPDGAVSCAVFETYPDATPNGSSRCEDLGAGECTPGSPRCRGFAETALAPLSGNAAAVQLFIPITVDGLEEKVHAFAEGPACDVTPTAGAPAPPCNLFVKGSDAKKRLVCELRQVTTGVVPAQVTQSCLTDPAFDLPAGDPNAGWCYASAPAILASCNAAQANLGTIRFLGETKLLPGSDGAFVCP